MIEKQRPSQDRGAAGDRGSLKANSSRSDAASRPDSPQQLTLDDLLAGRDQAEQNTDQWWAEIALQAVRAMARTGREFQAFDLVETYGTPEPDSPKRWGPLLARAAREGLITRVGAAPSRMPATARSLCWTWRGAP